MCIFFSQITLKHQALHLKNLNIFSNNITKYSTSKKSKNLRHKINLFHIKIQNNINDIDQIWKSPPEIANINGWVCKEK